MLRLLHCIFDLYSRSGRGGLYSQVHSQSATPSSLYFPFIVGADEALRNEDQGVSDFTDLCEPTDRHAGKNIRTDTPGWQKGQLVVRINYYRTQTKLRECNDFTGMCHSFCPHGRGCIPACTWAGGVCIPAPHPFPSLPHTPPYHTPLLYHTPVYTDLYHHPPPVAATEAGGTHPTGIHTC